MPLNLGDDQNVDYYLSDKDDAGNPTGAFSGTASYSVDDPSGLVTITDHGNGVCNVKANGPLGGPVALSVAGSNADGTPLQNADGTPLGDAVTVVPTAAVGGATLVAGTPVHN